MDFLAMGAAVECYEQPDNSLRSVQEWWHGVSHTPCCCEAVL